MYRGTIAGRKRKKRFKNLLLSMMFLCIITLMLAMGSRFFSIKDIKVRGNSAIPSSEIQDVVSAFYDNNLLRIKQETVFAKLTETLPIRDVKVSYKLPNTLIIDVKEREVAAAIHYLSGFALVDENGIVVALEQKLTHYSVPIITGIEISEAQVAKMPSIDIGASPYETLMNLIRLLKYMASELSEVHVEVNDDDDVLFCMYTIDGYQINLGSFDKEKIAMVKDILDDLRENVREKGILDMGYNSPVFKPFNQTSLPPVISE